ncbi:hypothetical protein ACFWC9_28995 [Streptomyces goshikiensis]|uniref:hypothetical protein n=1 Tax=Streptomyces goshikiensis TaxID=1942 RepID=UPI0036BDB87A
MMNIRHRWISGYLGASCLVAALAFSSGATVAMSAPQAELMAVQDDSDTDQPNTDTGGTHDQQPNTDTSNSTGQNHTDQPNTDTGGTHDQQPNTDTSGISSEHDRRLACENADRTWVETNNGFYCDLHTYKKAEQPNLNERLRLCLTVESHSGCRASADKNVIGGEEPVAGAKCTLSLAGAAQPEIGKWTLITRGGKAVWSCAVAAARVANGH